MNTRSIAVLVFAATLSASALPVFSATSSTASQSAQGYWASKITVNSWDSLRETSQTQAITAGTARSTVLALLGQPKQELASDVYVYDNCRPDQSDAGGCQTLVVTFEQDQVASLRFVNDKGTMVIAANLPQNTAPGMAMRTGFASPSR
jgi:outer membrane protein assembly factor BamE (lipoprotein component of BamABCDE complex)